MIGVLYGSNPMGGVLYGRNPNETKTMTYILNSIVAIFVIPNPILPSLVRK